MQLAGAVDSNITNGQSLTQLAAKSLMRSSDQRAVHLLQSQPQSRLNPLIKFMQAFVIAGSASLLDLPIKVEEDLVLDLIEPSM